MTLIPNQPLLELDPTHNHAPEPIAPAAKEKSECWSTDEENFRYQSLADLLDENDELKAGDKVYVGESELPEFKHLCDASDVIDQMGERAYEIGGEWAEDFPDVSKEAIKELDALLLAWMHKHCAINFWTVKNVKPYVLTERDFAPAPSHPAFEESLYG